MYNMSRLCQGAIPGTPGFPNEEKEPEVLLYCSQCSAVQCAFPRSGTDALTGPARVSPTNRRDVMKPLERHIRTFGEVGSRDLDPPPLLMMMRSIPPCIFKSEAPVRSIAVVRYLYGVSLGRPEAPYLWFSSGPTTTFPTVNPRAGFQDAAGR